MIQKGEVDGKTSGKRKCIYIYIYISNEVAILKSTQPTYQTQTEIDNYTFYGVVCAIFHRWWGPVLFEITTGSLLMLCSSGSAAVLKTSMYFTQSSWDTTEFDEGFALNYMSWD